MSNTKKTFVFNIDWYETLKDYPAEVRLEVYEAAIRYAASGTLSELKPLSKMAFSFIKKEMDYNREKYEAIAEMNRENGRKGGAPKGNKNASKNNPINRTVEKTTETTERLKKQPKTTETTLNDNVNDNVNKEILSNESTKKDEVDKSPSSTPSHYLNFMQWMETNAPNVYSGCGRSFTEEEYTKIRAVTSKERLVDCVLAIENRKDLLKKYRSLYLTLRNWIKRDEKA